MSSTPKKNVPSKIFMLFLNPVPLLLPLHLSASCCSNTGISSGFQSRAFHQSSSALAPERVVASRSCRWQRHVLGVLGKLKSSIWHGKRWAPGAPSLYQPGSERSPPSASLLRQVKEGKEQGRCFLKGEEGQVPSLSTSNIAAPLLLGIFREPFIPMHRLCAAKQTFLCVWALQSVTLTV